MTSPAGSSGFRSLPKANNVSSDASFAKFSQNDQMAQMQLQLNQPNKMVSMFSGMPQNSNIKSLEDHMQVWPLLLLTLYLQTPIRTHG